MTIGTPGLWIWTGTIVVAFCVASLLGQQRKRRHEGRPGLRPIDVIATVIWVAGGVLLGAGVADDPWISPLSLMALALMAVGLLLKGHTRREATQ